MSDYEGPSPEQLGSVVDSTRNLSDQVAALREESQERFDAGKQMLKLGAGLVVIALVVSVVGAVYGKRGSEDSERANATLREFEEQRQERSIASCHQTNDFYEKHNALVVNDQQTFRIILAETESDTARRFAQERVDSYELNKVALRDCTPAGIERYLSTTTTTEKT